jgi:hypothetical protein
MEITREEEQLLSLYRQCSPMQRMLITDALQEMLAIPGEIDLFSEAIRDDSLDLAAETPLKEDAAGAENMGKILPFPKR